MMVCPSTEHRTGNENRLEPGTYLDSFSYASVSPMKKASGRITNISQNKN